MNRIVLIGNGFDIAHNYKTSYYNFLDDYYNKIKQEYLKNPRRIGGIVELPDVSFSQMAYLNFSESLNGVDAFREVIQSGYLIFKNKLLEKITNSDDNWGGIEFDYYELLCKGSDPSSLNSELEKLKNALYEYLKQETIKSPRIIPEIEEHLNSPFDYRDFTEKSLNNKVEEIYASDERSLRPNIKDRLTNGSGSYVTKYNLFPIKTLLLNFNYTSIPEYYLKHFRQQEYKTELSYIPIHGSITDGENKIIFGFGDELDKNYGSLEDKNNREFLKNIKSVRYLETSNYKKTLDFVNSDEYQIFIFGHSCGVSDRTLLNTLFEHKNCVSIKTFYHQIDGVKDNFSDLSMNITRNFNNKASLRDKVANKEYCKPLTTYKKK